MRVTGVRVPGVWDGGAPFEDAGLTPDPCPFDAERDSQVGDCELVIYSGDSAVRVAVVDTERLASAPSRPSASIAPDGPSLHAAKTLLSSECHATVDAVVLKCVLGSYITLTASLAANERLRFDSARFGALSLDEQALQRLHVETIKLPRREPETNGAVQLWRELRLRRVRCAIDDGVSRGTHVAESGAVIPFVVLSEGSVATGKRRLEAVACVGVDGRGRRLREGHRRQRRDDVAHRLRDRLELLGLALRLGDAFGLLGGRRQQLERLVRGLEVLGAVHAGDSLEAPRGGPDTPLEAPMLNHSLPLSVDLSGQREWPCSVRPVQY